jgi:hypothetical protein
MVSIVTAQTLKIQGGTSISNLNWNLDRINSEIPLYDKILIGHSVFLGIDYAKMETMLLTEFFNLSSNIGLIRKGGQREIPVLDENGLTGKTLMDKPTLDYLSINTTMDLKWPINFNHTIFPFVSFGPKFDYLLSSSKHFEVLEPLDKPNNFLFGLILGGGVKFDIGEKFQIGLRADYYFNFNSVADWRNQNAGNGGHISVNTFTIGLSIGFRLGSASARFENTNETLQN